jgi:hypothetical protein
MKTTLNIPDSRIEALLKATKAKTKTEAINKAIEEFIYQENVKALLALEGSSADFMSQDELQEMRHLELIEQGVMEEPKQ